MMRSILAIAGFCVVLGYQNCGRAPIADGTLNNNGLSNPTEVTPVEKINVSETRVVEVPDNAFLEAKLQVPVQQAQPTSVMSSHHLEIDVKSGVISVLDQNNEKVAGVQYCLNAQDLQNLDSILGSAKICEDKAVAGNDLNCTMDYKFPYAKLQTLDAEIPLGESMSGCHHGPDLCGAHKDQLQSLLADLQVNLATKSCDFQVVGQ